MQPSSAHLGLRPGVYMEPASSSSHQEREEAENPIHSETPNQDVPEGPIFPHVLPTFSGALRGPPQRTHPGKLVGCVQILRVWALGPMRDLNLSLKHMSYGPHLRGIPQSSHGSRGQLTQEPEPSLWRRSSRLGPFSYLCLGLSFFSHSGISQVLLTSVF